MRHVLRYTINSTKARRHRDTLAHAVSINSAQHLRAGLVIDASFAGELSQSEANFTVFRLFKLNILSDEGVDQILVSSAFFDEFLIQHQAELLGDFHNLLDVEHRSSVNDCCEGLVHILRRSVFLNVGEPALDLITHGVDHIVDGGLVFIVDQVLSPDFGVDFLSLFKVLADLVLALGDLTKEFVLVDVEACLALA